VISRSQSNGQRNARAAVARSCTRLGRPNVRLAGGRAWHVSGVALCGSTSARLSAGARPRLASVGALAGRRLGWSSWKVGPLRRLTAETSSTPPHKRLVHSQPVLRATVAGFVSTEPEAVVIARIGIGVAFGYRAVRTRVASVGPEVCPIPSPPLHCGPLPPVLWWHA